MRRKARSNKRILYVCNVDWFFWSHRINLAEECVREGWQVFLFCRVTTCRDKIEALGVEVVDVPFMRKGFPIVGLFICFFKLLWGFLCLRPTVVHLITPLCNILGGVAARIVPPKHLVIAISGFGRSFGGEAIGQRAIAVVLGRLYGFVCGQRNTTVITQTEGDKERVLSFKSARRMRVTIIPGSGVDLQKFFPSASPPEANSVLLACRLLKSKGVMHFLKTAQSFSVECGKDDRPTFVLAGRFDMQNSDCIPPRLVESLDRQGVIRYVGDIGEMPELLRATSLFFYPSLYGEGLPKILCEAAACGVPVLTTNHSGCRDAIEDGVTGVLLDEITVEHSCKTIQELLKDRRRLITYRVAARRMAEARFDLRDITRSHMLIYEQDLVGAG